MDDNFRIGIIGGKGKMGSFFKNFFEKKGFSVLISDISGPLTNIELVNKSRVILISVPLQAFQKVIEEIAEFINFNHWVIDICSLKREPVRIMKKYLKKGEILATHPLFGPYEKDLKGKTIAFYPIRGKNIIKWFKKIMLEEGINLVKISPKKHDEIMALVQVINHFWLIVLAKIIKDSKIPLKDVVFLSTPSFLSQLHILKRLSWQDAELYTKIQLNNPMGKKLRSLLCKNCVNFNKGLNSKNAESIFKEYFNLAKEMAIRLEKLLNKVSPDNI